MGGVVLEPEQILHACLILTVESEAGLDESLISQVQSALGCDDEDRAAAMEHIQSHRDGGKWGGRRDGVISRSLGRIRESMDGGALNGDELGEHLNSLLSEYEDDGEIDPFAELGVASGASGTSSAVSAGDDLLAAFYEDDGEEEQAYLESETFSVESDSDEDEDEEDTTTVEPEPEPEAEPVEVAKSEEMSPAAAYDMLLSTCWVDGILDPAEARLLARKREELGISFETHLELLRAMLEREG